MSTNGSFVCLAWLIPIHSIVLKPQQRNKLVGDVSLCGTVRVESDELRRLFHQCFGHVGQTSGHGRLADPYRVSHGRLEGARRVEAQRGQHLDFGADGPGPLGPSAESLDKQHAVSLVRRLCNERTAGREI